MEKGKICFIEHNPYPETIGGGTTHITELGKELIKKGHEVHVITSPPEDVSYGYPHTFVHEGLLVHRAGMPHNRYKRTPGSLLRRPFYEMSFFFKARRLQNEHKFDIVLAQNPMSGASAAKKPFVLVQHGIHNQGFKTMKGKLLALPAWFVEFCNVRRASKIVSISNEIAKHYNGQHVIPNGVNVNKFKPGKKIPKTILFVGRLSEEKNIGQLIEAMDNLPEFRLLVIGKGPLGSEVSEMCLARKNCKFLGYKTQDELVKYYSKSKYICIPSKFENIPFVLLEGMSAGCIPIVSQVGGMAEIIVHGVNGYFTNPTPQSIASTITTAEDNEAAGKTNEVGRIASDYVRRYNSWSQIADKTLELTS